MPRRLAVWIIGAALFGAFQGGTGMAEATSRNAALEAYPDAVLSASADGVTVKVGADGRTVSAQDPAGTTIWSVDVIKQGGEPNEGFPVVRYLEIKKTGSVSVVVGKGLYLEIDLKTGNVATLGED